MKRSILITICIIGMLFAFSACGHEHVWVDATCTEPKTCSDCGETEGEPLGHSWKEADCLNAKTCSICGTTEGNPLGHTGKWDNCTGDGVCLACNESLPPKGHTWIDATCTEPKLCSECGASEGEALGHTVDVGTCDRCGEHIDAPLVTYEQILAGGYEEKAVRIQAIVGDVQIDYSKIDDSFFASHFDLWYQLDDTYVCENYISTIYDDAIEECPDLAPLKQIVDGDIIEITITVYEDNSFGMTNCQKVDIVDHVDIDEVYANAMNNAPAFDYNDIMRNPDNYDGHKNIFCTLSGSVFQVIDSNSYLIKTNSGTVYVESFENHDSEKYVNLLEGDSVILYGEILGVKKYSSLLKENTVPWVQAVFVHLK